MVARSSLRASPSGAVATGGLSWLRVAMSIKLGKITPSMILRRLGTFSHKNKLYFAFRKLGRVIRTLFLLDYISDIELRQSIHATTNKSEEFNNFVRWLFCDGVSPKNLRHEQRKVIKYSQLVANRVIAQRPVAVAQAEGTPGPGVSRGRAGFEGVVAVPDQSQQPIRRLHAGSFAHCGTDRLQD